MANKRFGLKEVANVIFFNIETGKPEIFFDTLKVSTIENESESAEARGGQGNGRLITWDYGRTATLTIQDALLSDVSLAMLSGNAVEDVSEGVKLVGREELEVKGNEENGFYVELKEANIDNNSLTVFKVVRGVLDPTAELTPVVKDGGKVELEVAEEKVGKVDIKEGDKVMAFYEYTVVQNGASKITFSAEAFPATYRVVGDTLGKDQYGELRKMQFVIPKAKLQSTFSLTMDVENVSVFDFNLDVLVDPDTKKLYEIITL